MSGSTTRPELPAGSSRPSFFRRYLDPTESLEEALFGLIMVLTFTLGAGLLVKEGHDATREMLVGIVGCNIAWGIIDAVMYLMSCMLERSRRARLLETLRGAGDEEQALAIVGRELDERIEPLTSPEERRRLYGEVARRLRRIEPERTRLTRDDLLGAIATFLLVFLSTLPAVLPFLIFGDRLVALRVSNLLLLAMIFLAGWRWGRLTHGNAWLTGSALLLLGGILSVIAIALGG